MKKNERGLERGARAPDRPSPFSFSVSLSLTLLLMGGRPGGPVVRRMVLVGPRWDWPAARTAREACGERGRASVVRCPEAGALCLSFTARGRRYRSTPTTHAPPPRWKDQVACSRSTPAKGQFTARGG